MADTQPGSVHKESSLAYESLLALIESLFSKYLNKKKVPKDVSFFELGGSSLMAMRVIVELRAKLDVDIDVKQFYASPSVSTLGGLLIKQGQIKTPALFGSVPAQSLVASQDTYPATEMQVYAFVKQIKAVKCVIQSDESAECRALHSYVFNYIRFDGKFSRQHVDQFCIAISERHPLLKASVRWDEGRLEINANRYTPHELICHYDGSYSDMVAGYRTECEKRETLEAPCFRVLLTHDSHAIFVTLVFNRYIYDVASYEIVLGTLNELLVSPQGPWEVDVGFYRYLIKQQRSLSLGDQDAEAHLYSNAIASSEYIRFEIPKVGDSLPASTYVSKLKGAARSHLLKAAAANKMTVAAYCLQKYCKAIHRIAQVKCFVVVVPNANRQQDDHMVSVGRFVTLNLFPFEVALADDSRDFQRLFDEVIVHGAVSLPLLLSRHGNEEQSEKLVPQVFFNHLVMGSSLSHIEGFSIVDCRQVDNQSDPAADSEFELMLDILEFEDQIDIELKCVDPKLGKAVHLCMLRALEMPEASAV